MGGASRGVSILAVLATAANLVAFFVSDLGTSNMGVASSMVLGVVKAAVLLVVALWARTHAVRRTTLVGGLAVTTALSLAGLYIVSSAPASGGAYFVLLPVAVLMGACAAFGLLLLGCLLVDLGGERARRVIVVGFCMAFVAAFANNRYAFVDASVIRPISLLVHLVLVCMLAGSLGSRPMSSCRATDARGAGIVALLLAGGSAATIIYATSVLLTFVFSLFQTSLVVPGPSPALYSFSLALGLLCCCLPSILARGRGGETRFYNVVFLVLGMASLAVLPLFVLMPGYGGLFFAVLLAGVFYLQMPIWIALVDIASRHGVPAAYLFGVYPGVISLAQVVGQATGLLILAVAGEANGTTFLVIGALSIVSVAMVAVLVALLRREGKTDGSLACRAQRLDQLCRNAGLTEQDRNIVELYSAGRSVPYISGELCLAQSTVRTHIGNVYAKLGIHSKQELIALVNTMSTEC